jgi:acetyl-CoA C-acetyltransferase
MTRGAFVLGGSQTDFAAPGESLPALLVEAVHGALDDAGVDAASIQVAHIGNFIGELTCGQGQLGGVLAAVDPWFAGLPTGRHEAACASGSLAVLGAMADLEAGRYDVALVVGVEILRNVGSARAADLLGCGALAADEYVEGTSVWPAQFAAIADEYDRRWGLDHRHLGAIAELNIANARRNPRAQTRRWQVADDAFGESDTANPPVAGMLRRMDCSRITDGAAAVVLAAGDGAELLARRRGVEPASLPRIKGWGHRTGPIRLADKLAAATGPGHLFPHARQAALDALGRAAVGDPHSLDALEVHDCFSISEYVAIDHFGLTAPGEAWKAVEDGTIAFDGPLPVNPGGGLLGIGHPVGATGVRMLLDAARQVSGTAGECQVPGAANVATSNIGGSYTTVVDLVVGVDG